MHALLVVASLVGALEAPPETPPDSNAAPPRPVAVVLPFHAGPGVEPALAARLTDRFADALREAHVFQRVLGPGDVEAAVLNDAPVPALSPACDSDVCHGPRAAAAGADLMVVGSVTRSGAALELNARLVEVRRLRVTSAFSRRVCGTQDDALLRVARPAARRLMVDAQWLEPQHAGALLPPADTCDERVLPSAGPDPAEEPQEAPAGRSHVRPGLWVGAGVVGSGAVLAALLAFVAASMALTALVVPQVAQPPLVVGLFAPGQLWIFLLAVVALPASVAVLAVVAALGLAAGSALLVLAGRALPG
jgi:hypothetical protein